MCIRREPTDDIRARQRQLSRSMNQGHTGDVGGDQQILTGTADSLSEGDDCVLRHKVKPPARFGVIPLKVYAVDKKAKGELRISHAGNGGGICAHVPATNPLDAQRDGAEDICLFTTISSSSPMAATNSIINCKLLLIGNSSVGKSSLLMRFSDEQWLPEDEASATIGVDFRVSR